MQSYPLRSCYPRYFITNLIGSLRLMEFFRPAVFHAPICPHFWQSVSAEGGGPSDRPSENNGNLKWSILANSGAGRPRDKPFFGGLNLEKVSAGSRSTLHLRRRAPHSSNLKADEEKIGYYGISLQSHTFPNLFLFNLPIFVLPWENPPPGLIHVNLRFG